MKVLFVSSLYPPHEIPGAQTVVPGLAEELAARGEDVAVATLAPEGMAREEIRNGVRCYYLSLSNVYWPHGGDIHPPFWKRLLWHVIDAYNPVMAAKLGRIIAREQPDVINMHNIQGFSVAAWREAKRRGVPVVQTVHDYYLACTNSTMYRHGRNCVTVCAQCRVLGTPRRSLSNVPVAVTAVSRGALTLLERSGLFGNVTEKVVIPGRNGKFAVPQPRRDRRPGEVVRFGFFGRIVPIKGLDLLLEAMRHVPADRARLLVGGQAAPGYIEHLQRSYPLPNVEFIGFADPDQFFPMIDVLVIPSLWEEPFSRVGLESLAHGVPLVTARVGGLPELADEGKTSWLFSAGDAAALSEVLRRIVTEGLPAARLFDACRKRSTEFDFPIIFDQYLAVLRRAIGTRAAAARSEPVHTLR